MTQREQLLDDWQQQLTQAEGDEAQNYSWSVRMRLKLYRFLLSMYGRSGWPSDQSDMDESLSLPASSTLAIAESDQTVAGKAPRTRAEILAGLRNIKGLSAELAPPGPLEHGLSADSPVVVTSSTKQSQISRVSRRLNAAGFHNVVRWQGKTAQVLVAASHAHAAIEFLKIPELRSKEFPSSAKTNAATTKDGSQVAMMLGTYALGLLALSCTALFACEWLDARSLHVLFARDTMKMLVCFMALFDTLFLVAICMHLDRYFYNEWLKKTRSAAHRPTPEKFPYA